MIRRSDDHDRSRGRRNVGYATVGRCRERKRLPASGGSDRPTGAAGAAHWAQMSERSERLRPTGLYPYS